MIDGVLFVPLSMQDNMRALTDTDIELIDKAYAVGDRVAEVNQLRNVIEWLDEVKGNWFNEDLSLIHELIELAETRLDYKIDQLRDELYGI